MKVFVFVVLGVSTTYTTTVGYVDARDSVIMDPFGDEHQK
jgi:hypothetical protein